MTTRDAALREYQVGYLCGVRDAYHDAMQEMGHPDQDRGYAAGRAAYEAAEREERERLAVCPACHGHGTLPLPPGAMADLEINICNDCGGSGRTP